MVKALGALVAMAKGDLPTWAMVAEWRSLVHATAAELDTAKRAHTAEVQRMAQRVSELEGMVKQASVELEKAKMEAATAEIEKYHAAFLRGRDQGKKDAHAEQAKAVRPAPPVGIADQAKENINVILHPCMGATASTGDYRTPQPCDEDEPVAFRFHPKVKSPDPNQAAEQFRAEIARMFTELGAQQAHKCCGGCERRNAKPSEEEPKVQRSDDCQVGVEVGDPVGPEIE